MKHIKVIMATMLTLTVAVKSIYAQEDKREALKSYSFVEAQGGVSGTVSNAKFTKLLMPQGALSFGHFFSPDMGVRLHVSGLQAKGRFEDLDADYKWKYVTTSADLLVNLTSIFTHSYQKPLNLMFVAGIGLAYAWDNDELHSIPGVTALAPMAWKDDRFCHNWRLGLRMETKVSKPLGLSLELGVNSLWDRFNSKLSDNNEDWMFTAAIGVSWRFGKRYAKPAPSITTAVQDMTDANSAHVAPAKPIVEEKPAPKKPVAVVKTETLHEEIFYVICKTDPEVNGTAQLKRVADFMKKCQDAKVQIIGYADKGTGNAKSNAKFAQLRASQCKDILVNKYGCDSDRLLIDSKGDTVQPFKENDKNRCVIIDAEGQYSTYE